MRTHQKQVDDMLRNASPQNEVELVSRQTTVPSARTENGPTSSLTALVSLALETNPGLRRLEQQVYAAWDKVRYVEALPDPVIGANGFGHPIETAAGSQRANLSFVQMIPWLKRLDAQGQQAAYEAMALEQVLKAEQLKLTADVKSAYYQLYVFGQQIRVNKANQQILEPSIKVATERVGAAAATQGDVLLGTLELSRLAEELVSLEQRLVSTKARLNQMLDRPAESPVPVPDELFVELQPWTLEMLRELAVERQPEIVAAQMRTQATTWGVQVAALRRMPDFSVNFNWFFIEDNRPASRIVDVGQDAWSAGASVSIPLWRDKYDAIESEAARKHLAAHAATDDVIRRYDALLADLLEQARAADETATLYEKTILPQARQTLQADQQSYGRGKVEFDRVVRDFRNLLTLEFGYHRAIGRLATAIARIEQAVGNDLNSLPAEETR